MECIGIIIAVIRTIVEFTIDLADRCPEIISPVITTFGTVISICAGIFIALSEYNKYTEQKRKDVITQYLIDAWTKLANASHRIPPNEQQKLDIESSIAAIALFGSKEQAMLANEFCEEMDQGGPAEASDLLEKLREDLRKELNIPAHTVPYKALRFSSEQYYTINYWYPVKIRTIFTTS